ncbi:MAG: hypothetical protein EAS51_13410 [Microbacteriaceae bacterium]|nr:MAG: hypothetical protein EAS51_13410 [Microbacteriaceae bacterium]
MPPPLVEPPSSADTPTVAWTPPAPTAPPATAAPTPSWDHPTQMMDAVPAPTTAVPAPPAEPQASIPPAAAADLSAAEQIGSAAIAHDASTTSALEALFGEENFRDYSDEPTVPPVSFGRRAEKPEVAEEPTAAPAKGEISRTQKILLGVAGGLVALLALFALFLLGTRLPVLTVADATPTPTPTPTAAETVPPLTDGPVEPGVWAWNELLGGECLDPYDGPWEVEYTVVECADPHPAQLAYRGELPPAFEGELEEPFPGAEALLAQVQGLCSGAGVLDLAAAGQYTDMQVEVAYPVDAEQWDAGERHYFCFVSRSSGEPLTGSVAIAPAPPAEG